MIDPGSERRNAVEYCLMRRILRPGGYFSLVFGALAVLGGFAGMSDSILNAGLLILGVFMLVEGIWILKAPSPSMMLAECALFVILAAWNVGISVLDSGPQKGRWTFIAIIQVVAAVQFFKKYQRFAYLRDREPSAALVQEFDDLIKRTMKAKPGKEEDVALLTTFGGKWKIRMHGDECLLTSEKGDDLLLAARDELKISDDGKVALGKDRKVFVEVRDRKLKGQMNSEQRERLENWTRIAAGTSVTPGF